MEFKGIGTVSTFTYDYATKKLATKSEDEADRLFVKYFNGELDTDGEHLPEAITNCDYTKRGLLRHIIDSHGEVYYKSHNEECAEQVDLSIDLRDTWKWYTTIDGHVCQCGSDVDWFFLTKEERLSMSPGAESDFETLVSERYNPETNSIKIGVGSSYELMDGYTFTIEKNRVSSKNHSGRENQDTYLKAIGIEQWLQLFLHFLDGKFDSYAIYSDDSPYNKEEYTSCVKGFLNGLGVDTSKPFTVNGRECVYKDGKIMEADYRGTTIVPAKLCEKAAARYEEYLAAPVENDRYYRFSGDI